MHTLKRLIFIGAMGVMTFGLTGVILASEEKGQVKEEGNYLSKANELWKQREDRTKLEEAIQNYEKAAEADPGNRDLLSQLSRACYFLADGYLEAEEEKQLEFYNKGIEWGKKAMMINPEFKKRMSKGEKVEDAVKVLGKEYIEAIYWSATSLGKWAQKKGFVTTLTNKDRIKKLITRVLEMDEKFFYGAPHRYFGSYYAVAPSFAGGDLKKSEEHFNKSIEIAPNYFSTRVQMAEKLATKKQDRKMFQEQLEFVLKTPADVIPEIVPEQKAEKRKAEALLGKIDEFFAK